MADKPGRPGGPDELSDEARKALFNAARVPGMSRDVAAITAGIHPRTLYTWLAKGKTDSKAASVQQYRQFRHDFLKAEAEAEAAALALISKAGQPRTVTKTKHGKRDGKDFEETTIEREEGDWRALAWILERRKPHKFGRRDHMTHAGDDNRPVKFVLDTGGKPDLTKPRRRPDEPGDDE
jgi:hypothetical protein